MLLRDVLPNHRIPDASPAGLDPRGLFDPPPTRVWCEIGFGGGEHLLHQARSYPDTGFLAVDPYMTGLARVLDAIEKEGIGNVRISELDAMSWLPSLAEGSLDRVYCLFPDPWPKKRHHKRRLVGSEFVTELARAVAMGGRVRLATDWAHYAEQILIVFRANPDFRWMARRADDWRFPPHDHVTTRYQTRGLGNCAPVFLEFERLAASTPARGSTTRF